MLVLTRKSGQKIEIGGGITIKVIRLTKGAAAIGIDAPKGTLILRSEVAERDAEEKRTDSEAA